VIIPTTVRFDTMHFPSRFVGPKAEWANGGVVAGTLAEVLAPGPVTVRLERPIPVETELVLENVVDCAELRDEAGNRLAVARRAEPLDLASIGVAPFAGLDAADRTVPSVSLDSHPAATCFVCGPEHPDGLDLQPGPVADGTGLATVLHLRDDLAFGSAGVVTPPVVWASMDCPGWFAGCEGEPALLGTMTAEQYVPLHAGDTVVVQSWLRGTEGRKVHVGCALWTPDAELVAASTALWIATPGLFSS
jgi:hypothetical protein